MIAVRHADVRPVRSRTGTPAALALALLCPVLQPGCGSTSSRDATPLRVFGRTGIGVGEFNYPRAATWAGGRIYIVDKAGRIQAVTTEGEFLGGWRMPEIERGKPTGLGLGPDGRLYVADTHYSRVVVFSPSGAQLEAFGTVGDGPGQFRLPTDVAVDRQGFVYVSEYGGNDRISKFGPDHQYLWSFGNSGEGRMERPQGLLIAPDGSLWVADACNHRVCHFDPDGAFLGEFGRPGSGPGELRFPYALDMLSDGTIVVCEYGNNRIQRFDAAGRSLGCWGRAGREPGHLAYPWALVVVAGDRIVVIDSGNNRVQVIDGLARRTWGDAGSGRTGA